MASMDSSDGAAVTYGVLAEDIESGKVKADRIADGYVVDTQELRRVYGPLHGTEEYLARLAELQAELLKRGQK